MKKSTSLLMGMVLCGGLSPLVCAPIDFPTTDPAWKYQSIPAPDYTPNRSNYNGYDLKNDIPTDINQNQSVSSSHPLYTVNVTLEGSYKDSFGKVVPLAFTTFRATLGKVQKITLYSSLKDLKDHSQDVYVDYKISKGTPTLYVDTYSRHIFTFPLTTLIIGATQSFSDTGDQYNILQNVTIKITAPYR